MNWNIAILIWSDSSTAAPGRRSESGYALPARYIRSCRYFDRFGQTHLQVRSLSLNHVSRPERRFVIDGTGRLRFVTVLAPHSSDSDERGDLKVGTVAKSDRDAPELRGLASSTREIFATREAANSALLTPFGATVTQMPCGKRIKRLESRT